MSQELSITKSSATRGVTFVEIVFGASILALVVASMFFGLNLLVEMRDRLMTQNIALYQVEEGIELVRYLRDDNWTNISSLAVDTVHYLEVSTTTISSSSTPEVSGEYTRQFVLRDVYRDFALDDLVASTTPGAYVDTDARWVEVSVIHPYGTTTIAAFLANIF